jgi:signal peptidase
MAGRKTTGSSSDEEPDVDDQEEDEEETKSRRSTRRPRPRRKRRGSQSPVRRWETGTSDAEKDEEELAETPPGRKPIYWRARDSLWFEPLVALAIIVVLIVGLFAYTQNWPPVYVVESDSMQHGSDDRLGLINTGDLVLAQKISNSSITPYVIGMETGYSTYGEYGDVLLYQPNGAAGTPVIHRAILFLSWDPVSRTYSAPGLSGLPCGNASDAVYSTSTPNGCGTSHLTGTLDLYRIGWMSVTVSVGLGAAALGGHSGYLTMGDNNYICSAPGHCTGEPDQEGSAVPVISSLVEPGWVVGAARGMLPWFGALKLLLSGQASMVPPQSWQFLGLTVAGLILLAFGIHYALRREGIETPLRKREDEERAASEEAEGGGAVEESRARRWLRSLRPWGRSDKEEGDEDEEDGSSKKRTAKSSSSTRGRRGRPRPEVKRSEKKRSEEEDEDEL